MDFIAERVERARRLPPAQRGPDAQGFIQGFELQQQVTAQLEAAGSRALDYKEQLQVVLCLLRAHWVTPEWWLLGAGLTLCAQEATGGGTAAEERLSEILSQCTCTSATCPTPPLPLGSLLALSVAAAQLFSTFQGRVRWAHDTSPAESSERLTNAADHCAERLVAGRAAPVRHQWQAELAAAGPCGGWTLQELRAAMHCLVGVANLDASPQSPESSRTELLQRAQRHLTVAQQVLPVERFPCDMVAWILRPAILGSGQPGQEAGEAATQLLGAVLRSNNRCLTAYTACWTALNMCQVRHGWQWEEVAEVVRQADEALASIKPWCPSFVYQRMAKMRPGVECMMAHARQLFPRDYTTRLLPACSAALQNSAAGNAINRLQTPHDCSHCGKGALEVKFCAACKSTVYCSRDCQTQHWPQHRQACQEAVAAKKSRGPAT